MADSHGAANSEFLFRSSKNRGYGSEDGRAKKYEHRAASSADCFMLHLLRLLDINNARKKMSVLPVKILETRTINHPRHLPCLQHSSSETTAILQAVTRGTHLSHRLYPAGRTTKAIPEMKHDFALPSNSLF